MESDDLAHRVPRKRSRSPSASSVAPSTSASAATERDGVRPHAPKRLRRSRDTELGEHERHAMARANPLGRRVLKREAKKARQAAKRASRAAAAGRAGMEVDRDEEMDAGGLEATFMG